MKTSENKKTKTFKGAGYLIGSAITLLSAIGIFIISENVVVSLSASIPIGFTIGVIVEQRFQKEVSPMNPKAKAMLKGLLILGIIVFILFLFLANQS